MSLDLCIKYKDASRPEYWHPFCFQSVLREQWWPLAERHGLETLQRLENLFVEDRTEAEQMVRELRFVENLLKAPDHAGVPQATAQYMLDRLAILLPVFDGALSEWANVKELSI
jgi:hypothetical protein